MTRAVSVAVAAAGLGIAGYLALAGGDPVCGADGGCAAVQSSAYAELAGVPVSLLGVLGYTAILVALARDARTVAAFLALTGFGFSAWLTYVSQAKVGALCPWCVASAVCMTLLAGLAVARLTAR